ncbi:MAG: protein kinase [Kineosporiaceae bacterium]|nr:protein kinase [Kineosporiaceae bacterium]
MTPPTAVPNGTRCTQPGCTGTIQDGYCDVCGSPAGAPVVPAASSASAAGGPSDEGAAGGTPSTASKITSSNRLESIPIGSARAGGTRATRSVGTGSTRLRGARLGAGLTFVPPVPALDPEAAIMKDPQVPEDRRFCPSCGTPVGRSREGRPGRLEGFCPQCRNPFSFTPKLRPGDLVGGQYEVAGCLAHGGLGWIYLARDVVLGRRWVVLKGLLNSGDADAYAAAIAEREFLAKVEHPLIVEIFNFAQHEGAGYIVMEYIGGTSLKDLLKQRMQRAGRYDPIPVDQAIAYLLEILPAFTYLHDQGLLYCDFKPDNIIQVGDAVKLIDLGGVRRIDDLDSPIYGTVGYQAPEVPTTGPSIASDIYTIGRTLAVLVMEFRGYQSTYATSLPPVAEMPLFQQYDSLFRLLAKACALDPNDRFQSADELRVQLLGVLREIVALDRPDSGVAQHSTASVLFEVPVVSGDTLSWTELPALRVDASDPQAAWLAGLSVTEPVARWTELAKQPSPSVEVRLAMIRAALEAGRHDLADGTVQEMLKTDPWEWRAVWMNGLSALDLGNAAAARAAFNAVYGQVPGELAPKLALALACELSGEGEVAESLYLTCARTDANYTAPAAFGMARIRLNRGEVDGAVAALDLVPSTSRAFVEARRQRAGLLAGSGRGLAGLAEALDSVSSVTIEPLDRARLEVNVLGAALRHVLDKGPQESIMIGGHPARETSLRDAVEGAYRRLATMEPDTDERVRLVDAANEVRRWTLR